MRCAAEGRTIARRAALVNVCNEAMPDLVSGGFFITRALARPSGLGHGLLPDELLTLSSCLTEFLPDGWALEWSSCSHDERVLALTKLGLSEDLLPTLMRVATDAFASGELGWPCVWNTSTSARTALATIGERSSEFVILEVGLSVDVASELVAEFAPGPGMGSLGFIAKLSTQSNMASAGVPLGWEVLGIEHGGSFHSWLCNSIESEAEAQLAIRPGKFGLLASHAEADAVVELIRNGIGAEPVPWFAAQICRVL